MEHNIIADNGLKREPAKPAFRLAADITTRKFDARQFVTEIATSKPLSKEDLSGNPVRIGAQWSIVKASGPSSVTVWGKIAEEGKRVEVLERYGVKK
jgi:hypothetical protein